MRKIEIAMIFLAIFIMVSGCMENTLTESNEVVLVERKEPNRAVLIPDSINESNIIFCPKKPIDYAPEKIACAMNYLPVCLILEDGSLVKKPNSCTACLPLNAVGYAPIENCK